jgi:hypothetical protein
VAAVPIASESRIKKGKKRDKIPYLILFAIFSVSTAFWKCISDLRWFLSSFKSFILGLFNDAVSCSLYVDVNCITELNWKWCGRKWSCSNLTYYSGICLQRLRKIMKSFREI